jgi:hypothetical protein
MGLLLSFPLDRRTRLVTTARLASSGRKRMNVARLAQDEQRCRNPGSLRMQPLILNRDVPVEARTPD